MTIYAGIRLQRGLYSGGAWVGPRQCCGAHHLCQGAVPATACGDVAGRQEVARRRLGGVQAVSQNFSQICINVYVNKARRRKPDTKFGQLHQARGGFYSTVTIA